MPKKTVLTCPHCRNSDPRQIIVLFPHAAKYYKVGILEVDKLSKIKAGHFFTLKRIGNNPVVPNFFRCEKCESPFRLNKCGKEYVPRVSRLACPKCGFDEFGAMKVYSSGMRNEATTKRSRAKVKFYTENTGTEVNGFECPECKCHFFVNGAGLEYPFDFSEALS